MKRLFTTFIAAVLVFGACDQISPDTDPVKEPEKAITFSGSKDAPTATFTALGGDYTIKFETSEAWTITTASDYKWLKINPMSGGGTKGENTITITVEENSEYDSREATITLSTASDKKQIKISQAAKAALILENNEKITISVLGGNFTVKLNYNLDFEVSSDVDWIYQEEQSTKALKTKELNFFVDANNSGEARSGKVIFKTKDSSISEELVVEQGHEITITEGDEIDLGLSVKWARTNLGATNPEDRGDFFAWGETQTHTNNKFYYDDYRRTMDSYYRPSGTFDTRKHLSDDDDAATVNLGNKWRMPTQKEMFELLSLKFKYPYKYKDNQGLLIIAANGNTLFVPASGYEQGYGAAPNQYDVVCFWTNEVANTKEDQAYILCSHIRNSTVPGLPFINGAEMMMERFSGLPVRAVRRADITFGEFKAEVSETSATLSIDLNLDGIDVSKIKRAGFLYSAVGNFTATSTVDSLFCTPTSSNITFTWDNLESSSTYKVRPFLVVEKEGNYTGSLQSITTKDEAKLEQWTDLGLSVLWASWNVGAKNPGDNGNFFHWGDTEPKEDKSYNMSAYKYYVPNSKKEIKYWEDGQRNTFFYYYKFTKYDFDDQKTILESSDDAASVHWGNGARTPSKDEVQELLDNCELKEITKYGSRGYIFTSKINGNSIFISSQSSVSLYYKLWTSDLDARRKDIYYNRGTTINETLYDYSHVNMLIGDHIGQLTRETAACVRAVKDK